MTAITIELRDEVAARLEREAHRLNVTVQELAALGVSEFLARPDETFERTAKKVLEQNQELYRRLA